MCNLIKNFRPIRDILTKKVILMVKRFPGYVAQYLRLLDIIKVAFPLSNTMLIDKRLRKITPEDGDFLFSLTIMKGRNRSLI